MREIPLERKERPVTAFLRRTLPDCMDNAKSVTFPPREVYKKWRSRTFWTTPVRSNNDD